jgi:hypothetical protein
MTELPSYDIEHDAGGFYVAWSGYDLCHGRRYASFGDAEEVRACWEAEDREAQKLGLVPKGETEA